MGTYKAILTKILKGVGEEIPINTLMNAQWMSHDKTYWGKLMNIDGTVAPIVSGGIVNSMINSVNDISANSKNMKYPYMLMLASKDIVVDNKGAQDWHKKTATPADKKVIKQFYNCFH